MLCTIPLRGAKSCEPDRSKYVNKHHLKAVHIRCPLVLKWIRSKVNMPRVAPHYRFIKMHYLETRRMRLGLSEEEARQQALDIWDTMTTTDKDRIKERIHNFDIGALSWEALCYYDEIEGCSARILAAIVEDEVLDVANRILASASRPIFLIHVRESPDAPSYPEELSIIKLSLGQGTRTFFHGLFDGQRLVKLYDERSVKRRKHELEVVGIRNDPKEEINLKELAAAVRMFVKDAKLFALRSQVLSCHNVVQLLNHVDTKLEHPTLGVYPIEELLRIVVGRDLSVPDISHIFETIETSPKSGLACDFHQHSGLAEECTLLNALLLTQCFAEIVAAHHKHIDDAPFTVKSRPRGKFFSRDFLHKRAKPPKMIGYTYDGVFKVPIS